MDDAGGTDVVGSENSSDAPAEASCPPSTDLLTDPQNCGSCGHDCLGGACTSGVCQPLMFTNSEHGPLQLVLMPSGAYWANWGTAPNYGMNDGSIRYWANTASSPVSLTSSAGAVDAVGVAVGAASFFFETAGDYGTNHLLIGDGKLLSCPLGGCPTMPSVVVADIGTDAGFQTYGAMTQSATNYYWSQENGLIYAAPLAGGAPKPFATGGVATQMVTDAMNLYYIPDGIWQVPLTGGTPQQIVPYSTSIVPQQIAVANGTIFAVAYNQSISVNPYQLMACPTPACPGGLQPIPTVGADGGGSFYHFGGGGIAANSSNIFWMDFTSLTSDAGTGGIPQLMTCNPTSCAPKALMFEPDTTNCASALIAASDSVVYWICTNGTGHNTLARLAL